MKRQKTAAITTGEGGLTGIAKQFQARLELPAGEPDLDGLRAVTREWLVPALVERFLREHGIVPRSQHCADTSTVSIRKITIR